jgi:diguanylate cyclase (GGDEF)-like protein/PAS domain S-box-containing protein
MGNNIKKDSVTAADDIRRRAEERVHLKKAELPSPLTEEAMKRLVHELEVHQIQLEMQNENLRLARDEAETSLRRYTDLFDFSPVGYFNLDSDGKIIAVNLNGASLIGIARSNLIGRRFGQFISDNHRNEFKTFFNAVITSKTKDSCEVALLHQNKLPVIVQIVQIEALADPLAQECHLAVIDITARRLTEDSLRESEERLYRLAGMAVDAIIMVDDSETITFCNAAAEEMFKCTAAEIIGKDFHGLFVPDRHRTSAKHGFEAFRGHGTGPLVGKRTEVVALRKDGTEFPLELSVSALQIKNKWHAIGIMRDITARKTLEAEIQDAREYAENIVETVRRPLVVLNADMKIRTANYSFYRSFKVTPEETIGHSFYELGNRQWDIPKLRKLIEGILLNDTKFNSFEVEHDFPTIGCKTFILNARQIFQKNTGSHIVLLAMEDITTRKMLEAEIQDAREYAENIVETVREPLVVLNADLKILTANHSFYDTFAVTPEATIGNFIYDLGNRQWDIPKLRTLIEEILPHDTVINGYEVEHDFPGIGIKTILLNARQIFREKIGSHIILLAMEDITARRGAEERINEIMRQQQAIFDNIPNIAWLKDKEGRYVLVNIPFSKTIGMLPVDLIGKSDHDIYPQELADKYEKDFRGVITTGQRTYFEEAIVNLEGATQYVEKIKTPIFNNAGGIIGVIGIAHDITTLKKVEVSLRHDSTHDALTGLYNRAFFDEELERFTHSRMFPVSIVMADVNCLKIVNDTFGHEAGDTLIRLAAQVISAVFREEDIVARIGGDEFAVLLPETDTAVAEEAVRRIKNCPEITNGKVSIAFGIASAQNKGQLTDALKLSDERMYLDKSVLKGL